MIEMNKQRRVTTIRHITRAETIPLAIKHYRTRRQAVEIGELPDDHDCDWCLIGELLDMLDERARKTVVRPGDWEEGVKPLERLKQPLGPLLHATGVKPVLKSAAIAALAASAFGHLAMHLAPHLPDWIQILDLVRDLA